MTFWGTERIPHEAGEHAHESPPVMLVPLMVLAVGAVAAGIIVEPFTHWFSGLVERTPYLETLPEHKTDLAVMAGGVLFAVAGVGVAFFMYVYRPGFPGELVRAMQRAYQWSLNKAYFDELYDFFIVQPLVGLSRFCRVFDQYVVDSLVDLLGQVPRLFGVLFRPMQNGLVQFYALAMVAGLVVFLIALVRALAG
jgi:NADH-quinone oxidoreductase subunit L